MTEIAELILENPATVILRTEKMQHAWTYGPDDGYPGIEWKIIDALIPPEDTAPFYDDQIKGDRLRVSDVLFQVRFENKLQLCEPVDLLSGPKLYNALGRPAMGDFFNELLLAKKQRDKLLLSIPSLAEGYERLKSEGILITRRQTGSLGSYKLRKSHPFHHIILHPELAKFPISQEVTLLHELGHAHFERSGINQKPLLYLRGVVHDGEHMDGCDYHRLIEHAADTVAAREFQKSRAVFNITLNGYHARSKIVVA